MPAETSASAAPREDLLPVILGGDISVYSYAREFHEAGANVDATAQAAKQAMAAHQDARAVFEHVNRRIARDYRLPPGSQIAPDGTVTIPPADTSAQA